jgi:hypothetical protein
LRKSTHKPSRAERKSPKRALTVCVSFFYKNSAESFVVEGVDRDQWGFLTQLIAENAKPQHLQMRFRWKILLFGRFLHASREHTCEHIQTIHSDKQCI